MADRIQIKRKMPDGSYKHFYGFSKREAEQKYRDALTEFHSKSDAAIFAVAAKAYMDAKLPQLRYGTQKVYVPAIKRAIAWFGDRQMDTITTTDISRKLELFAEDHQAKTVNNQRSVINEIYKYWCNHMNGTVNPCLMLSVSTPKKSERREPPPPAVVDAIKQHPEFLAANLFYYTGMRKGEALALKWSDIDFDRKVIHITKQIVYRGNFPSISPLKTKKAYRDIPLLDKLYDILHSKKSRQEYYILSGSAEPLKSSEFDSMWAAGFKQLGLFPCTSHQLRHEYASVLVAADIPEIVAMKMMGHADISTTYKWYAAAREDSVTAAAEVMNNMF